MMDTGDAAVAGALYAALEKHDYDGAAKSFAEDALVLNVATGDVYRGREGFLEYARGWSAAFPGLRFQAVLVSPAEGRTTVEYEIAGGHGGPLTTPRGHIPPTGMEAQVRFCDVLEIHAGQVTHLRSYFDSMTLLRQLGLVQGSPIHAPERRAPLELYVQPVDAHAPQWNKAIVHRFLQEVFNRRNPGAAADTCGRNYLWYGGPLGTAKGIQAYEHVLGILFGAFPDLTLEPLDTVAEDDRVVVRFAIAGTHLGEFQGIAPTARRISCEGTNTYRIEGNRIVEEWWQADMLGILQQIEAVPTTIPIVSG